MTKYVTFFVVAVFLGSSLGRAASAAPNGDGSRTASSNEQAAALPSLEGSSKSVEKEWTKEEQGFGATLLLSDKPQQFLDDWNKQASVIELGTTGSVSRGKPIVAFIVFTGCGADKQGLGDVLADMSVLTPDGKVLGENKAVDICQKRPVPPVMQLQLGVGNLGIVIEPNDPAGTYEFHAKVSDRVKGVVLELKAKFSVDK
jgi:hypothetical protein